MKILIHIGYPKAWSKFIQKHLFVNANMNYLNGSRNNFYIDYLKFRDFMKFSSDDEFNNNISFYRNKLEKYFDINKTNLYSDEFFLCPNPNGYKMIFRLIKFFSYNSNQIDFIIFTRKQSDLFNSYYAQAYEEFVDLNPMYKDYKNIVNFFKSENSSPKDKNFFKIWNLTKVKNLIKKLNHKLPVIINCEDLQNKDENSYKELSNIFNLSLTRIYQIFNEKKIHSSVKSLDQLQIKNLTRIVIKYPITRYFLRYFSMDFKLYIKSLFSIFFDKKFITIKPENNKLIDDYYKNIKRKIK